MSKEESKNRFVEVFAILIFLLALVRCTCSEVL